jgi:hypothetical protein
MTEALRALSAECLHCGVQFTPRKAGHVFHSRECRHKGERPPRERVLRDVAAIARLLDRGRDVEERVREDDWHPNPGTEWVRLDACETVRVRRHWYTQLLEEGRLRCRRL